MADLFADIEHRGLVHLALADHDGAVDVQDRKGLAHGFDGHQIGGVLVATADLGGRGDGGRFGDAHGFEGENAVQGL